MIFPSHKINNSVRTLFHPRGTRILVPIDDSSLDQTIESFANAITLEPHNLTLMAQYVREGQQAILTPYSKKTI